MEKENKKELKNSLEKSVLSTRINYGTPHICKSLNILHLTVTQWSSHIFQMGKLKLKGPIICPGPRSEVSNRVKIQTLTRISTPNLKHE